MNQTQAIINYLMPPGRSLTPLQALKKFGCFRLGARAWDIKKANFPIKSEMVKDKKSGKHYCKYYFA
jgi:hypothetical protein